MMASIIPWIFAFQSYPSQNYISLAVLRLKIKKAHYIFWALLLEITPTRPHFAGYYTVEPYKQTNRIT
jgi:hypothetical protein